MFVLITLLSPVDRIVHYIDWTLGKYLLRGYSGIYFPGRWTRPSTWQCLPFFKARFNGRWITVCRRNLLWSPRSNIRFKRRLASRLWEPCSSVPTVGFHLPLLALCGGIYFRSVLSRYQVLPMLPFVPHPHPQPARGSNSHRASQDWVLCLVSFV